MKKTRNLSLIVIYGVVGAGKTTLADFLHNDLSYTAHIGVDPTKLLYRNSGLLHLIML